MSTKNLINPQDIPDMSSSPIINYSQSHDDDSIFSKQWEKGNAIINNLTTSDKGDTAYVSTLSPLVNLYSSAGSILISIKSNPLENNDIISIFKAIDNAVINSEVNKHQLNAMLVGVIASNFNITDTASERHIVDFLIDLRDSVNQDVNRSMAFLLCLRDIRKGMGNRSLFRLGLMYLEYRGYDLSPYFNVIVKLGRWDDLMCFNYKETITKVAEYIYYHIKHNLDNDLMYKWLPRWNSTKDNKKKYLLIKLAEYLGIKPIEIRHLMMNRIYKFTTEQLLSSRSIGRISYDEVPSQAMMKYHKTFKLKDSERYSNYLRDLAEAVKDGNKNVKVNTGTLWPHQLVAKTRVITSGFRYQDDNSWPVELDMLSLYDSSWRSLPDYLKSPVTGRPVNILPMIDTSGSMEMDKINGADILDIAIALGLYVSQRMLGIYRNLTMTFSKNPVFLRFLDMNEGHGLDKVISNFIGEAEVGLNTDIRKAIETLCEFNIKYNVPFESQPDVLLVLSDMNFDDNNRGINSNDTLHKEIVDRYTSLGLKVPKVVFWNLNHNGTFACTINESGVCELSGFSPSVFNNVLVNLDNISPTTILETAIKLYLESIMDVSNNLGMTKVDKLTPFKPYKK